MRKSSMRRKALVLLAITPLAGIPLCAIGSTITLGSAGNFAVLAYSTVTNTGSTVINGGDVGLSPDTLSSITGFPPGTITPPFIAQAADSATLQAQNDLASAYNAAAALPPTQTLTGQDLGGKTLTPGVYFFASSAALTGTLTLNDQGNATAQFVFQIASTLDATGSVVTINNPGSTPGANVFWQVGSSATLETGTAFQGHILALDSITLDTGATIIDGSALAETAAVTLDDNTIDNAVPEPATMSLVLFGGTLLGLRRPVRGDSRGNANA